LPIYRNQTLAVVGGGDTAMEETSYLTKFASKVHVIHRRDALRASKAMQDRVLSNPKVEMVWDSVVEDVVGQDRLEAVVTKNLKTGATRRLDVRGLFIAIGHAPATGFLKGTGVELDEKGYVVLRSRGSQTNIEGVFAAGDLADQTYRQAITAAGMGCQAAIDCERWLAAHDVH
jgi:thioredoxin reductase (NADPH)